MCAQFPLLFTMVVISARVVIGQDASDESDAIERIKLSGGKVKLEPSRDKVIETLWDGTSAKVAFPRPAVGVTFGTFPNGERGFIDDDLPRLKELTKLTTLNLAGTHATDAALKEVCNLRNLTKLDLSNTRITDAGLKELSKFRNLFALDLRDTAITDAGLKEFGAVLKPMKTYVGGSAGEGAYFFTFTKLTDLNLEGTKVTENEVDEFKHSAPTVQMVRSVRVLR
jgi:hypothetical protein